tara:strand:- start:5921 stop:6667 length:747 start_codon:yes stop_codon:yes gene_type:complete
MYNGKTVSLGAIIWKVFKNKLITDLSYDDAAEYALEFIRLVGAPLALVNEVKTIKVTSYKAALPDNLITIRGIKMIEDTDSNGRIMPNNFNGEVALRYATDIYHQGLDCDISDPNYIPEYTYEVQKGIIFTSFEEGTLQISYKGIGVDEDGYPLIPDNEKFTMGLEYYISHRYLEGLWAMGKITDKVFQYYEQKRHWYLGAANSSMQMQNIDQLESTMNGLNRIVRRDDAHETFFRKFGRKERIKKYH